MSMLSLFVIMSMTACSQEGNTLQGVEETAETFPVETVTQETTTMGGYDENKVWDENDYTLSCYLPDEYFYDTDGELDFFSLNNEKMHIKVTDCYFVDSLEEAGDYFTREDIRKNIQEIFFDFFERAFPEEEMGLVVVEAEFTNLMEQVITFCMFDISFQIRAYDNSMVQYGVNDKKLIDTMGGELYYDYGERGITKDYYMIEMQPGESFKTKILYRYGKSALKDENEVYLDLGGHHIAQYDAKLGRIMPKENDPKIRYLRIYPRTKEE